MDVLKDKKYTAFDYTSRYASVPHYYNTLDDREMYGTGYNLDKATSYVAYKVKQGDTLDKIALSYYNNPTYWWVIAYFNDIQDAMVNLYEEYDILKLPAINSIVFTQPRV